MIWWTIAALLIAPQFLVIGLTFAPMSFWQGIDQKSSNMAAFLWGFSHLMGPRLKVGDTKPWYDES